MTFPHVAKKSLGQHFLMHSAIANRIVSVSSITQEDTVLEIGPGTGILTRELLTYAGTVIAVEADAELFAKLSMDFSEEISTGKLTLYHEDIRTFEMSKLPKGYVLVANIPYYITGEILRQFLTAKQKPRSMTLLMQKEVVERIARSKKESLLSLSVKVYGTPHYAFTVPRGAFMPAPNVDSAVLIIEDISNSAFSTESDEIFFFSLVRAGFAHKRKQLAGNLSALARTEKVLEAMSTLDVSPKARAEDVSLANWKEFSKILRDTH